MLGKLFVALAIVAAPALASDPAPADSAAAPAQDYKIKKVCRTVEVAGSFIPRTSCVNKKIPIKKPDAEAPEAAKTDGAAASETGEQKKEQ